MQPETVTFRSTSPEQTHALAQRLAGMLEQGDVVLLTGPVGAGKTHFTRGVIRSLLASPEDIPSPTFTLVQTYATKLGEIWHADLYRLTDTSELEELGLTDAFTNAICFIEWPDRLGELAPTDALHLTMAHGTDDAQRDLTFSWTDARWAILAEQLDHA